MRQWRLIYDYPTRGADNMAIDEAILEAVSSHLVPPTLRLYAWHPPCLSLGYGQRSTDVDFVRARALGWSVVRRPTGGRAILHADELTYSLSLPSDDEIVGDNVIESYRRISAALVAGLSSLGIQPQADRQTRRPAAVKPMCFETHSHYEITISGRKLVGSAQLRRKNGILQHGCIPLTGDIARICEVLTYPDEASRYEAQRHVRERAITLTSALSCFNSETETTNLDWTIVARAIAQGFSDIFQVNFTSTPGVLTVPEKNRADQLFSTVYGTEAWRYRR